MPILGQPHDTSTSAQAQPGFFVTSTIGSLLNLGLDLLFPPRCANCGRVDELWCARCQDDLAAVSVHPYLRTNIADVSAVAATGVHAGILREAVTALKYENRPRILAEALGKRLAARLKQLEWSIDIVLPVPLHADRLKQRGYNQAQFLSEYAAGQLSLTHEPSALRRERYTTSQVGLSRRERAVNLLDAFIADSNLVKGRTLLLIDDVCTTGSTLTACAQALREAGAQQVYGLTVTVARA